MRTNKWLLIVAVLLALTACGLVRPSSPKQSSEPTQPAPVPVVICGEDIAGPTLAPYPMAPAVETKETLRRYSQLQQQWAVDAAGVVGQLRALRAITAGCIADLRERGAIN